MMSKRKFLPFSIYVGLQSFVLQLTDKLVSPFLTEGENAGFVFIAFGGWALYFLLGSRIKGAVKGICGYGAGIGFAILMVIVSEWLSLIGMLAVPIVAAIVVPVMMYFEYAPWWLNDVAVFFIGAGAFYGIYNYLPGVSMAQAALIVLLYCTMGLVSGVGTVYFRNWYESRE